MVKSINRRVVMGYRVKASKMIWIDQRFVAFGEEQRMTLCVIHSEFEEFAAAHQLRRDLRAALMTANGGLAWPEAVQIQWLLDNPVPVRHEPLWVVEELPETPPPSPGTPER